MRTALGGIRVLDQTQVMAGPFCSMLLADMGADVVKIEPPGGEHTRREQEIAPGVSASFLAVNRNKRSLVLDLKLPAGVAVLKRLIATADVLVENYRPGVARRLGVDGETLREINPRLIYCSISGFGQTGPYADRPNAPYQAFRARRPLHRRRRQGQPLVALRHAARPVTPDRGPALRHRSPSPEESRRARAARGGGHRHRAARALAGEVRGGGH